MIAPKNIACIGNEMAIVWEDGQEDYIPMERLRAYSPSAANMGEKDLLGNVYGGTDQTEFPGVTVTSWEHVGGYAIQISFSDGHTSGTFAFDYLRRLAAFLQGG